MPDLELDVEVSLLAIELEKSMMQNYGPLVRGLELAQLLGFRTLGTLRQAHYRNKVPVKLLSFDNRKGYFALTRDIAYWLATIRLKGSATQ